jgi:hypothetical protein
MPRAQARANRKPNDVHRKVALRKKFRKIGQPKFVVNWR